MRSAIIIALFIIVALPILVHAQGWYVAINSSQVAIVVSPTNSSYILSVINEARCCIYVEAYELTYQPLVNELASLAQRGVAVYVVLSGNVYGGVPEEEYAVVSELRGAGVHVSFNYGFDYVHSKVFVIDNETVIIGSINPTYYGFEHDLGIDLIINNSSIASVFANIILDDYHNVSITQINYPGIVVSPINSYEYLSDLLSQPGTLYMALEELYPSSSLYGLIQEHNNRLILVGSHGENYYVVNELGAVMINDLTAKAIVVGNYVYVGSINLDYTSLHENRELGIIIENPQVAHDVIAVIQQWYGTSTTGTSQSMNTQNTQLTGNTNETLYLITLIILVLIIVASTSRGRRRTRVIRDWS
ncbi:phospholipase D-like domain-containing protein [Vulcanisaeta sp. JCM 14467]